MLRLCRWIPLVLVSVLIAATTLQSSTELLTNPDFEDGLNGWTVSPSTALVTLSTEAFSGTTAVALAKEHWRSGGLY